MVEVLVILLATMSPNLSIERTFQSLRLCAAAHVKR